MESSWAERPQTLMNLFDNFDPFSIMSKRICGEHKMREANDVVMKLSCCLIICYDGKLIQNKILRI